MLKKIILDSFLQVFCPGHCSRYGARLASAARTLGNVNMYVCMYKCMSRLGMLIRVSARAILSNRDI